MKKLSRKKRKEIATGRKTSAQKKEYNKTPNEDGYVSKRSHFCWEHEYQLDIKGDYVCSICGYHTKNLSAENALREYFSSRTEYKISEIKELMQKLCKVSWYRNTRGQKVYYPVKPVDDVVGVMTCFGNMHFILDVNEDGSFYSLNMKKTFKKVEYENVLDIKADGCIEQLKANWKPDRVRNIYLSDGPCSWVDLKILKGRLETSSWYCETPDEKTYIYNAIREIQILNYGNDTKKDNFFIKLYVYGKDRELEKIVYRDQDGIYSSCK